MKNMKNNVIRDVNGTLSLSELVEVGGFVVDGAFKCVFAKVDENISSKWPCKYHLDHAFLG